MTGAFYQVASRLANRDFKRVNITPESGHLRLFLIELPGDEGGVARASLQSLPARAWLWLTSIGVTFVSAWILRLAPKGALPPVPSGAYQNAAKQGSPRKRLLLDRRLREFALQVASLHALGASRFAIGKTAAIKVFGIAKVLDDLHPLRLADCMSNPKIERVRLGLISLKSGSLADM